jgi:hypothetical protein
MPPAAEKTDVTRSVNVEGQLSASTAAVKPKNSEAKNWDSIEILFLSDHRVQICVNGKRMEVLTYAEFGFEDGRSENPNKQWDLLRTLAEEQGAIREGKTVGEPWPKIEKRIQEMRKTLREYFGLAGAPSRS